MNRQSGAQRTDFDTFGSRRAPAVVLVHGLGLRRDMWQWQVPALAGEHFVITYDLLGHGDNAAVDVQPSLAGFATQLAELLDALEVDRATVIGFSMGGMIARYFAQVYPDRLTALALLNTPHLRSPEAQKAVEARVIQARADGPAATVDAALARWFTDDFARDHPEVLAKVRGWVLANDPEIYPLSYRVFAEEVPLVAAPEPRISVPTLVMTGGEDYGNSPEMARAIAAEIEDAEVVILGGLRHMALAEAPARVNAPLHAFLSRAVKGVS